MRGPDSVFRFRVVIFLFVFIAARCFADGPMVDLNRNGMSDIWELIYNAGSLDPNADTDGDGVNNLGEALAGTNPFNSNSYPMISFETYAGGNFSVTLPAAMGKQYSLLSVSNIGDLTGTNWFLETNTVVRGGSNLTLTASLGATTKFFKISISDVDSDGDGVNDWEEYQLGLDPLNPYSNAQMGNNGEALTDYEYVVGKLAMQNVISISATDPTAVEPDPGQTSTSTGQFTITRGGFPLNSITVNLGLGGPGVGYATAGLDYAQFPQTMTFGVGVSSQTVTVTPLANTNLASPALAQLRVFPGLNYTMSHSNMAAVEIYPSPIATGTGLTGLYYTNSSSTYTNAVNFNPANLKMIRIDPTIDFVWGNTTNPITNNNGHYCVRWVGQVEPQYSEIYYFDAYTDDGVKVWVNDQLIIDNWAAKGASDSVGSILLQGGTKYDIRMDYFQSTSAAVAELYWYSPDQSRQIIPNNCLFPTNTTPGPTVITSPLSAVAFLGEPFMFSVTAANGPIGYTATGLPPGLTFNTTNGLISGVPTLAGTFQTVLTASNAIGAAASIVSIQVIQTGNAVSQELWLNVPGTNVSDIPVNTPANLTNALGALRGILNYGDNYGERIQGYFTAPVTGNYYFWIAASDSAELWISNDGDPVNKVKRAWVLPTPNPAPTNGTAPGQWNLQTNQQTGWLSLTAGQPYYIEILHKAGVGPEDNWSVGWLQDPTGTNTVPAGVVPGYLLSRYYPPLQSAVSGTLYTAELLANQGVSSKAVGSATLLVNSTGTQATLNYQVANLSSPVASQSIDSDPFQGNPSELIYDISASKPQPNGSFLWNLKAVGPLTLPDVQQIISGGMAYVNIATVNYPDGELSGHFVLANGSQVFTAPPAPPVWTDDSANSNAAARFLIQTTFGPSPSNIATVQSMGYSNWINYQFSLPASHTLPVVVANQNSDPADLYPSTDWFNAWWQQSITAQDQLRQRVAFALSEIMVISENGVLENNATALASYYDTLLDRTFGNFRDLLQSVTLTPGMGLYLDMQGNNAGSIITGLHADENYAREVEQLFSIGLNRLWPDGSLVMNAGGQLVPTYNQNVIMGFASVFTGWNYYQTNQANGRSPSNWYPAANYTNPMVLVPSHHDLGPKLVLDNVVLPPAAGSQTNSASTNYDSYGEGNLEAGLNSIFNNHNVAPFICRQLIQRLVTSSPSRDYVYRVASVFNDNGFGVRGDLQAVIRAILLDYEARSPNMFSDPTYGKEREGLLRVTAPARAFPPPLANGGTYSQSGTQTITITTTNAHLLDKGDTMFLNFTDTSGNPAPASEAYSVTVTSLTSFTVNAVGVSSGTYGQTNGVIMVNISGYGLVPGNPMYLDFTSGGATSGVYMVVATNTTSQFTVSTADTATRAGNCLIPKISGGGYLQVKTNVTFITPYMHGLNPGDNVFINFSSAGSPTDGVYPVNTVPNPFQFTIIVTNSATRTQDGEVIYPLVAPPLTRSGTVSVKANTWNMGYTDTGSTSSLSQSPLRSPTVFNFYYPTYEFPGALAAAGLTTPEFQLTSDTSVALAMNFLEGGVLNNGNNTNGISSFAGGNGSIALDLNPWMTPSYTSGTGIPTLVGSLNTLLVAGELSSGAQSNIVKYVTNTVNYPYSTPPTDSQMCNRVRAVVHLILTSPDFTIQK